MIETLRNTRSLPDDALAELLETPDLSLARRLEASAREVCLQVKGPRVLVRALIEHSNMCRNNCLYCGIRSGRASVKRYSLSPEDILRCCARAWRDGVHTFVIQGGENPAQARALLPVVKEIRGRYPRAAITLSLGELPFDLYSAFKEAGATRYLLRHETANPAHYASLHPAGSVQTTLRLISILRLMFPSANIPSTTALAVLLPGGKETGIRAGANVIMNVYTPETERLKYDLYKGKTSRNV